ncbi:hypothetical protein ABZ922_10190 [Streptomyces shenzhenensis]|uniref:hypothetical protein n=1 Tax=Streptomyces shenzhenensis TaxID=943815 RepID=UPI00340B6A97
MGSEDSFDVVPERIHQGSALISELGSYAWSILADFRSVMADTSWTGDDENGHKIRANFVENRDMTLGTLESLGEALERTGDATLMNLKSTQGTQEGILDAIGEQSGEYGGGGGRRG